MTLPVLTRRIDTLFERLSGDSAGACGGRHESDLCPSAERASGKPGEVDRLVAFVCGVIGVPLTGLQAYQSFQMFMSDHTHTIECFAGIGAVAASTGILLACAAQFFLDLPPRIVSRAAALVLTVILFLGLFAGLDLRLPAMQLGPTVFFLVLAVATDWRRWQSAAFVLFFALTLTLGGRYPTVADAVCAGFALAVQGLGVRMAVAAMHRQADSVENSARAVRQATVTAHEQSVALLERAHWDGLVHDQVINVLRAASQAEGDGGPWVRAEAQRSLALITSRSQSSGLITGSEAERRLTAIVQGICPSASLDFPHVTPSAVFHTETVMDLLSAAGEALRNAVRHAQAESIAVTAVLTPSLLRICVADDGVGFDERRISPTAMGIRGSIRGRMRRRGGSAEIRASRGAGTVVVLECRPRQPEAIPA